MSKSNLPTDEEKFETIAKVFPGFGFLVEMATTHLSNYMYVMAELYLRNVEESSKRENIPLSEEDKRTAKKFWLRSIYGDNPDLNYFLAFAKSGDVISHEELSPSRLCQLIADLYKAVSIKWYDVETEKREDFFPDLDDDDKPFFTSR